MMDPFRDAGFVVMVPLEQCEKGHGGDFCDEVDNTLATDVLVRLPLENAEFLFVPITAWAAR